jgi:hypothetical protein
MGGWNIRRTIALDDMERRRKIKKQKSVVTFMDPGFSSFKKK